jgi:hypothetical protein
MKELLTTKRTFLIVLFLGLLAMTGRNVTDPDVWWHLKTGEYIAVHKAVPHADLFSFTRSGQPWIAHEWLTAVLLFEIFRATGWGGLILVFAAILCAAFFLLYLRCGHDPFAAGFITLAGAWATAPLWGVRPQILSLLLTSLWLLILERSERNSRLLLWTLPLTFLWVNLHAGFALGLALLFLFLAGEFIERMLGLSSSKTAAPRLRTLGLALLLDLLVVPLNPNGLRMYGYPIETLRSHAMQNYIAEWASPNFHRAEYWPFLFLLLAMLVAFAGGSRGVRPRDLLLLIVGTYAALCSIRMIPLFVLIAVPILSRPLQDWVGQHWTGKDWSGNESRKHSRRNNLVSLNAAIILAVAAFAGMRIAQVIRLQPQVETRQFPANAVTFLQSHPPVGRLLNHYDWGGYLIWRLYPSTRVFIDGRADLYGEQFLQQFADTYQLKGSWQPTLKDWGIETVIVPPDSALATGLRMAPGWKVAYEDSQAVVLTLSPYPTGPGNGPDPQQPSAATSLRDGKG